VGDAGPSVNLTWIETHYDNNGSTTRTNTYAADAVPAPPPSPPPPHPSQRLNALAPVLQAPHTLNLIPDLGVCGIDAWAQEAAAGLTNGGFFCNAPPPPGGPPDSPNAGHTNYHTTWVDTRGMAWQEVLDLPSRAPLPAIHIGINPNPGVVNIESWFWIDRGTYANQPVAASIDNPVGWEESWDESTSHTAEAPCPEGDPGPCSKEVTEWHTVHVPHSDHINISETFTVVGYRWNFGDDQPGSVQSYVAQDGLGTPYTDPSSRSTVHWRYAFDSRDHPKGFPITATAVWLVTYHVGATSDMPAGNFDLTGTLGSRNRTYGTSLVVRQVQAPRVALAP
jgi:hypothetical protein